MKNERLARAIGKIDDDLIYNAVNDVKAKKKGVLFKWIAVAACLCFILVGIAVPILNNETPTTQQEAGVEGTLVNKTPTPQQETGVEGTVPDGSILEGGDPAMYRVAVIPTEASLQDVADATAVSVNEEEVKNIERLGAYLPDTLPEGYRYGPAGYFETTMKDGTQYHLIRVTYESGPQAVSAPGPENAQVWMGGSTAFIWTVRDHCPGNDEPIYQQDEVTPQFLDQMYGSVFFIDYDGVYVGIERLEISTEELMTIIDSIE